MQHRILVPLAAACLVSTLTVAPAAAQFPLLEPAELTCQVSTIREAAQYLASSLDARQDCLQARLEAKIPAAVNCLAVPGASTGDAATDSRLSAAMANVAQPISQQCDAVDFAAFEFPGACPDADGPPYDALNHATCIATRVDKILTRILPIQYAPLPEGFGWLHGRDVTCQKEVARRAGRMVLGEFEARSSCIRKQFLGTLPLDTVDCTLEASREAPGTGHQQTDNDIVTAHNRVLVHVANACASVDLSGLGFPNQCEQPEGAFFGVAQLVECLFKTHHAEPFRLIDAVAPAIAGCGNGSLNVPPEDCDDGNTSFTRGEACMADCSATLCGDPDGNTLVNVVDAMNVLRAGIGVFPCAMSVCDTNGDGKRTSSDGLIVLQKSVGHDVRLNCPPMQP